jgi:hypothetical protein
MAALFNTTVPVDAVGRRRSYIITAEDKRLWRRERRDARARLIQAAKARRAARASIEGVR